MELETKFTLAEIIANDNLAEDLSERDREAIGREVKHGYEVDKQSRYEWEERMEDAMKLALQVMEDKSFPWANASNVKFPLITIAALQYHARAYPALIPSNEIVKSRIFGDDPDGLEAKRARRIQTHMNYQLLEEDEYWEDNMDRVLITQPIMGSAFKKSWYNSIKGHNVSEMILAKDLVVSYYTKNLDDAPRITHVMEMSSNDIYEQVTQGKFLDVELWQNQVPQQDSLKIAQDEAQGLNVPTAEKNRPNVMLEQHCWIDLDGDGYQEPYIAVVHLETGKLLRLAARFLPSKVKQNEDGEVLSITPEKYFTKFPFIPSPDGGFYDLGFGILLGPLNESINTLINQLIDAGTMSTTAGGFLSRGVKIRGGSMSFSPNEWKPVDSTGDDLRKGIVPLPVREPSQVLFTLLSLLIDYGERIGGAVDVLTGQNPGQNTPAETSRNMAEQGMKIFNGVFKRTYRGLKQEFRKLYRLNQLYLDSPIKLGNIEVKPEDYVEDDKTIVPAADPNMTSDAQRVHQAATMLDMGRNGSGFNMYEVQKRMLQALRVEDIEMVLPDPKGPNAIPQAPHYKVQEAQVKAEAKMKEVEAKVQVAMVELQQAADLNAAKIIELEAKALKAQVESAGIDAGHQIAKMQLELQARKQQQEGIMQSIKLMADMKKAETKESKSDSE